MINLMMSAVLRHLFPGQLPALVPCRIERRRERGFTIIELLVVMAILGGVMGAVFTIYNMQRKVTHVEEDVVDVQQNVRIALDTVTRDIRNAGLMVTGATNPLAAVGNNTGLGGTDTLTLNTASATSIYARIAADVSGSVVAGTPIAFTVASADSLAAFSINNTVRIADSPEQSEPLSTRFTVTAIDTGVPSITLNPAASGTGILFRRGALIALTAASGADTFPNTILYCVGPAAGCGAAVTTCPAGQNCLMRIVNGAADDSSVVATNVAGFQMRYISDGSTTEADTPADISLVRAVRVTLTGTTVETAGLSGGAKTREITSIAKLRNR